MFGDERKKSRIAPRKQSGNMGEVNNLIGRRHPLIMIKKRTPFSYTCCQHMSDDDHFFLDSRTCVNTLPDNTWVMMIIFQRGKLLHMAHDDNFSQNGRRIYSFVRKTESFVFWHITEISARYRRQNDRTDAAHLFCFPKILKKTFGLFFPGCVFWWGVRPTRKGPGPIWAMAHMGDVPDFYI